jgi:hypothetical protein
MVSSSYFLPRRGGMVSLGPIAYNSNRVLNWSCVVAFLEETNQQRAVSLFILSVSPSRGFLHQQR